MGGDSDALKRRKAELNKDSTKKTQGESPPPPPTGVSTVSCTEPTGTVSAEMYKAQEDTQSATRQTTAMRRNIEGLKKEHNDARSASNAVMKELTGQGNNFRVNGRLLALVVRLHLAHPAHLVMCELPSHSLNACKCCLCTVRQFQLATKSAGND